MSSTSSSSTGIIDDQRVPNQLITSQQDQQYDDTVSQQQSPMTQQQQQQQQQQYSYYHHHHNNNNSNIMSTVTEEEEEEQQGDDATTIATALSSPSLVMNNNNEAHHHHYHHDPPSSSSPQQHHQYQQYPSQPQQHQQQPLHYEHELLNNNNNNNIITHAPDSIPYPPINDTTIQQIQSITQRLLGLRGCQPGTQVNISENEIRLLCGRVRPILLQQPMLLELQAPLKICGDVHGQYTDLLRLLEYGGFPPETNYLFLGDYVDRGKQSLETICLLLCYKIQYPENFFILRGNHESAGINRIYGFYDECKRRYSIKLWKIFSDVFNCLPICALIDEKILCMHGGLSPEIISLQQILNIQRPCDVPDKGLMCDLLWSDPSPDINGWGENDRGVSYTFGSDIVIAFLEKFGLDLICRAHQVVEDGYEFFAGRRLVTLFSAPNYCGEFDNAGGMISVNDDLMCSFQILKPSSSSKRKNNNNNNSKNNNVHTVENFNNSKIIVNENEINPFSNNNNNQNNNDDDTMTTTAKNDDVSKLSTTATTTISTTKKVETTNNNNNNNLVPTSREPPSTT